jgi:hypothetical protein
MNTVKSHLTIVSHLCGTYFINLLFQTNYYDRFSTQWEQNIVFAERLGVGINTNRYLET